MGTSQELADELAFLIRARFPTARVEVTGNERGTVWVEVWHGMGHAEAVFLRDGEIGVTDFREELMPDDNPFDMWAYTLSSVASTFEFLTRVLA